MTYPTNQIPSTNPQNFAIATPVGLQSAPRDPTAQDNTYVPGSEWQNTVTKIFWKCESSTIAGAVWVPFAGAGSGTVVSLTGNSGGAILPDGMGNINVVGTAGQINVVGTPNTLTLSLAGGGQAVDSFTTNVAGPVAPDSNGNIFVNASSSTFTNGAVANTLKTEIQGTNHALFVGRGALTAGTTIAAGTTGTVLIGTTGSDPSFSAHPVVTDITFGSGNALAAFDYGTFTPAIQFGGSSVGITYNKQFGSYLQIGKLVLIEVNIELTSKGAQVGVATLANLPISSSTATFPNTVAFGSGEYTHLTVTADYWTTFHLEPNSTSVILNINNGTTLTQLTNAEFANNTTLQMSISYLSD